MFTTRYLIVTAYLRTYMLGYHLLDTLKIASGHLSKHVRPPSNVMVDLISNGYTEFSDKLMINSY